MTEYDLTCTCGASAHNDESLSHQTFKNESDGVDKIRRTRHRTQRKMGSDSEPEKNKKNMVVEDSVSRPIKWGSENDPKLELSRSCFLNKFKVNVSCPETQS